ncbi:MULTISPECIES: PAS domain-containing sensor histidine kinase [unclassified Roseateles]|uniref:sensor histidine kinase n=1 Tax=unclassified Roseateles TaxID=2626991 RepID=UPI0006FCED2E|nr:MULTISPECIES: sensor histidine kinase [unclassified Roseateles]KQW46331.1 histidine kinase [Pelomonas sp. Root405]KRA73381.1 histidine kinase [Pelomonas sp. Root662]
MKAHLSLRARALLALALAAVVPPLVILGVRRAGLEAGTALVVAVLVMLPLIAWLAAAWVAPLLKLTRALEGAVLSYRDGDFSLNLTPDGPRELVALTRLHADLGLALREQRQHLAQRELLLDTVVQNTPVALVLTAASERIAIANLAARQLLGDGRSLTGLDFPTVIATLPETLREALAGDGDRLFTVTLPDGSEETFHHSTRSFRLQGQPHRLRLLRRMTRELSRAEVATWKRVIRVLSHELNNSLAPISSLAHSGAELARRGNTERLPQVLASIGERAAHLHGFLSGYAAFAKLPAPHREVVDWAGFLNRLATLGEFNLDGELPAEPGWFDPAQIEQALLNLIKNAHESGSEPDEIALRLALAGGELRIEVLDRGPGMSETVLAQALLPFYSTKRSEPGSKSGQGGTGLGLALAREIAEAHDGRIALGNREGGGLRVAITLPQAR